MMAAALSFSFDSFRYWFLDQCRAGPEMGVGEHLHDRDHGTLVVVACPRRERSPVPIKGLGERTSLLQLRTIRSGWDHTPLVRDAPHHRDALALEPAVVAGSHESDDVAVGGQSRGGGGGSLRFLSPPSSL